MIIDGKTVLVTGANRGIGQALVEEALRRGAARVYAAARHPVADPDKRVTPLSIDVTSAVQIQEAAGRVESLDVLINNAGIQPLDDLSDPAAIERALAVNLLGPYRVSQAFLPALTRSRGTIVNNVSLAALAPVPFAPAYSISKAAALSLTQSLRMLLARHGVSVRSVLTGPVDTEMTRGLEIPKASPESVARAIFDGIENGDEDIFPDVLSQALRDARKVDTTWSYLDITALGRQEQWEDSPAGYLQTPPYEWWNWHDEYGDTQPAQLAEHHPTVSAADPTAPSIAEPAGAA
jgi:NAD(P)-dependent dehydrogenase (short-subunit alcohol dehydrogenase family)